MEKFRIVGLTKVQIDMIRRSVGGRTVVLEAQYDNARLQPNETDIRMQKEVAEAYRDLWNYLLDESHIQTE